MNREEFILLTEEYLDGTIAPENRAALRTEVTADPARRHEFEEQARQHIRLHAQTSRVDFTESQHIAMMVVDIVEKHRDPNAFMEILRPRTWRERLQFIIQGLRAEKGTTANRLAKEELRGLYGPVGISMVVNVAILLVVLIWVPHVLTPEEPETGPVVTLNPPDSPNNGLEPRPNEDDFSKADGGGTRINLPLFPGGQPAPAPTPTFIGAQPAGPEISGPEAGVVDPMPPVRNLPPGLLAGGPDANPLANTRSSGNRGRILKDHGATPTDAAVVRALKWLQSAQAADGSWAGQDKTAMTGLALLAFLGHGETPADSPQFADTVTRGLKYLIKHQDTRGQFSANVYAHGIAVYALAEAFTMTRIVELRQPLDNGIQVILDGQQPDGSFDYNYRKGTRFDTSVSGWQIQALKAARLAGVDAPGLEPALKRSIRFLQTDAFAHDGSGFVYEGKPGIPAAAGGRASMTGVGTLCLQMLDKAGCTQVRTGLRTLRKTELAWPDTGKAGVYAGYYISQAKFQANDRDKIEWTQWNRQMQKTLLSRQQTDGHWENGDYDSGTHVYTTTLCTLMLEVYYRYLPTYAQRHGSEPAATTATGDVRVDVR